MNDVVFLGAPAFPDAARTALADTQLRRNLRNATGVIRTKRAAAVGELDDWEQLREAGAALKRRTLRHLDKYLLQLEEQVTRAGGIVHWAADAAAANRIVGELIRATGSDEVVKVKSMATQEIGLNEALAAQGIPAYETDLAELIVQLAGDKPSHILFPAVHRNRAEIRGGMLIVAGATSQLQAVQNGGGMALLADRLGYARLVDPVRFRAPWEQAASLRLREGDTTVLTEYDEHARITGGDPEQMMDAAAAAYVALAIEGTDTLLMAADHALRRELSRRIRDDLLRLGLVRRGPTVPIADGAVAGCGDLIVCTRNDHTVEAGEPGRFLANGDLLRIDAVVAEGLLVRRALDADPRTGQRRWTDRQFLYAHYGNAELGYAVTDHTAQGRTVTAGLALITGTEDRQHAYVALTRGTDENTAYVYTQSPKRADIAPGPRPAPELARYDRLTAQPNEPVTDSATEDKDALGVLAEVLDRDGQQLSACQTRQQALADADHLAILHAIWSAETAPAGNSGTRTCSRPPCRRSTGKNQATRPNGCGGRCAPRN